MVDFREECNCWMQNNSNEDSIRIDGKVGITILDLCSRNLLLLLKSVLVGF